MPKGKACRPIIIIQKLWLLVTWIWSYMFDQDCPKRILYKKIQGLPYLIFSVSFGVHKFTQIRSVSAIVIQSSGAKTVPVHQTLPFRSCLQPFDVFFRGSDWRREKRKHVPEMATPRVPRMRKKSQPWISQTHRPFGFAPVFQKGKSKPLKIFSQKMGSLFRMVKKFHLIYHPIPSQSVKTNIHQQKQQIQALDSILLEGRFNKGHFLGPGGGFFNPGSHVMVSKVASSTWLLRMDP